MERFYTLRPVALIKNGSDGNMAMFCSNCGTQLTEGGAFCYACGKPVYQTQPAETPAAPVAPVAPVAPAAPVAAKKKSVAPLIIAGVAVLVLAFALVGVFTQGFGLLGDTEEPSGSMANGGETPSPEVTPSSTPTPEVTPSETPTPETPSPSETPTPEVTLSETPTPESPSPDLPPNHISAEFLDVLCNGDNFYLSYMHYVIVGEQYGYVEYHEGIRSYSPEFVELARQGDLYVHRESYWAYSWWDHYFHKDNKEYKISHRYPDRGREMVTVGDLGQVTSTGVSKGRLTGYVGDVSWSTSHEYVGSGVGAVNGVQMPYDEYAVSHWGMDIPFRLLFYIDGGIVVFLATYAEGEPIESFAFSETFWSDPPGDFGIPSVGLSRDIPPDIFDLDYYLENYPIEQSESPPSRPGR